MTQPPSHRVGRSNNVPERVDPNTAELRQAPRLAAFFDLTVKALETWQPIFTD